MKFNIFFIRKYYDASQRKIAELLKVSKSTYARWERMDVIIPLLHLIDFCNITNTSLDFVLGLCENQKEIVTEIQYGNYVGINLKKIRIKRKLTQKEFANSLNTTQSVVSSYERNLNMIQTAFLYDICRIYKVSADKLLRKDFNYDDRL